MKIRYHVDANLLYSIQKQTKQSTSDILGFIHQTANEIYHTGSGTFQKHGEKEMKGFWPGTDIPFRLIVNVWHPRVTCTFKPNSRMTWTNSDEIKDMIVRTDIMGDEPGIFSRPKLRTPRGMKPMK